MLHRLALCAVLASELPDLPDGAPALESAPSGEPPPDAEPEAPSFGFLESKADDEAPSDDVAPFGEALRAEANAEAAKRTADADGDALPAPVKRRPLHPVLRDLGALKPQKGKSPRDVVAAWLATQGRGPRGELRSEYHRLASLVACDAAQPDERAAYEALALVKSEIGVP